MCTFPEYNTYPQYVYVVQINQSSAENIIQLLREKSALTAISPQIVCTRRKQGSLTDAFDPLLPGYLLVYSSIDMFGSNEVDAHATLEITGVIKVIGNPKDNYLLSGNDLTYAYEIQRLNGVVPGIYLVKDSFGIKLDDNNVLHDCHILDIDYRKKRAKVSFTIADHTITTWIKAYIRYEA